MNQPPSSNNAFDPAPLAVSPIPGQPGRTKKGNQGGDKSGSKQRTSTTIVFEYPPLSPRPSHQAKQPPQGPEWIPRLSPPVKYDPTEIADLPQDIYEARRQRTLADFTARFPNSTLPELQHERPIHSASPSPSPSPSPRPGALGTTLNKIFLPPLPPHVIQQLNKDWRELSDLVRDPSMCRTNLKSVPKVQFKLSSLAVHSSKLASVAQRNAIDFDEDPDTNAMMALVNGVDPHNGQPLVLSPAPTRPSQSPSHQSSDLLGPLISVPQPSLRGFGMDSPGGEDSDDDSAYRNPLRSHAAPVSPAVSDTSNFAPGRTAFVHEFTNQFKRDLEDSLSPTSSEGMSPMPPETPISPALALDAGSSSGSSLGQSSLDHYRPSSRSTANNTPFSHTPSRPRPVVAGLSMTPQPPQLGNGGQSPSSKPLRQPFTPMINGQTPATPNDPALMDAPLPLSCPMFPSSDTPRSELFLAYFDLMPVPTALALSGTKSFKLADYLARHMTAMDTLAALHYDTVVPFSPNNKHIGAWMATRKEAAQIRLPHYCRSLALAHDDANPDHQKLACGACKKASQNCEMAAPDGGAADSAPTTPTTPTTPPTPVAAVTAAATAAATPGSKASRGPIERPWTPSAYSIETILGLPTGRTYRDIDTVVANYHPDTIITLTNPTDEAQTVQYSPPFWYIQHLAAVQTWIIDLLALHRAQALKGRAGSPIHAQIKTFLKVHRIRSEPIERAIIYFYRLAHIGYIVGKTPPYGANIALDYGEISSDGDPCLQFQLIHLLVRNGKFYEANHFLTLFADGQRYPATAHLFQKNNFPLHQLFPALAQTPRNHLTDASLSIERKIHCRALQDVANRGTRAQKYYHIPDGVSQYVTTDASFIDMFLYIRGVLKLRGFATTFLDPLYDRLNAHVFANNPNIPSRSTLFGAFGPAGTILTQDPPPPSLDIQSVFNHTNTDPNFNPPLPHTPQSFNDAKPGTKLYQDYEAFLASSYGLTIDRVNQWTIPVAGELLICGFDTEFSSFELPSMSLINSPSRQIGLFQVTVGDFTFAVPRHLLTPLDSAPRPPLLANPIAADPVAVQQLQTLAPIDRLLIWVSICRTLFYTPNIAIAGVAVSEDVSSACGTLNVLLNQVRPAEIAQSRLFPDVTNYFDDLIVVLNPLARRRGPGGPSLDSNSNIDSTDNPTKPLHLDGSVTPGTLDINNPLFRFGVKLLAKYPAVDFTAPQSKREPLPPVPHPVQPNPPAGTVATVFSDSYTNKRTTNLAIVFQQRFPNLASADVTTLFEKARPQMCSLAKWTKDSWNLEMFKEPVTMSNWERFPLHPEQIMYACLDAFIALELLKCNYQRCVNDVGIILPHDARRIIWAHLSTINATVAAKWKPLVANTNTGEKHE